MQKGVSRETTNIFNKPTSSTRVVNGVPITRTSSEVIKSNTVGGNTIRRSHNNITRKVVDTAHSSNNIKYVGQPHTVHTESNPKRYVDHTINPSQPQKSYVRRSSEVPHQSTNKTHVEVPKVTVIRGEPRIVRMAPERVEHVKTEPQYVPYKKESEVHQSDGVLDLLKRHRYDKVNLSNYTVINKFSQSEVGTIFLVETDISNKRLI